VQFCSGDVVALWQRLGLSALVTLAAVRTTAVAAGALTFPLWWPLLQAAGRNRALRARFRCGPAARAAPPPALPARQGSGRGGRSRPWPAPSLAGGSSADTTRSAHGAALPTWPRRRARGICAARMAALELLETPRRTTLP